MNEVRGAVWGGQILGEEHPGPGPDRQEHPGIMAPGVIPGQVPPAPGPVPGPRPGYGGRRITGR